MLNLAAEVELAPAVGKPLEDGGMGVRMGVSEAVNTGHAACGGGRIEESWPARLALCEC